MKEIKTVKDHFDQIGKVVIEDKKTGHYFYSDGKCCMGGKIGRTKEGKVIML